MFATCCGPAVRIEHYRGAMESGQHLTDILSNGVKVGFLENLEKVLKDLQMQKKLKTKIQVMDGSGFLVQFMPKKIAFLSSRYRPKRSVKAHLLTDSTGVPLSIETSTANVHDSQLLN